MDDIVVSFADLERFVRDAHGHNPDYVRLSVLPSEDPDDPDDVPALLCEAVSSQYPGVVIEDFIDLASVAPSLFSVSGASSNTRT